MRYRINKIAELKSILVVFRKSKKLSQRQLASQLGVTQQTYQVLESAPEQVAVVRLFKVLSILDVNLELIESEPLPQNPPLSKENLRRSEDRPISIVRNGS